MSVSAGAVNRPIERTRSDLTTLAILCLCFVLSGLAALVYQTAWTRQFALVFGTSELAVATVLAAYMGGLALGAWGIERLLPRVGRPVLTYAVLELGIGVAAVALVPALLLASDALLVALFDGQAAPPGSERVGTSLFYLASAFVVLSVPTVLMGATLPLLARHAVRAEEEIGRRIGLLYAVNTAGAVGGALLTAFVLLPGLGLRATVWVGAAINALVFVLAALLSRHGATVAAARKGRSTAALSSPRARLTLAPAPAWVLPIMLFAGAAAFAHEVLWTRMLSHVLGSSIYAFGVMVASFLTGIAVGGAAGAWLARDRARAATALAIALLASAAAAAVAYLLLDAAVPEKAGLVGNAFFAGALLLPMTLSIGATYPLAVRVLAASPAEAAGASARVYAWNTVGAIAGALAAGFVLIPALRYEGTVHLLVYASALLAIAAAWLLGPTSRMLAGAVTVLAGAGAVAFQPQMPQRLLLTSPLNVGAFGEVLYYGIGRSASVVVLEQDGGLALRTNGLPEALMETPGLAPRFSGEFWLSPLAVIARPRAERMLIVGYGGGVVVEGVPPSVRHIDVVELEPEVMAANRATRQLRKRDPLTDPRLNVITNDARGALALTSRRYDAIVSQPSHPWTAGASHLYTREFMRQARAHLNDGGVFVQWMNVAFLNEALLRSLTATLIDVFGQVRIYRPDPNTLVFLASSEPLELERQLAATGLPLDYSPGHYARYGINSLEDLVGALAADTEGARELAAGAPLITDDHNRIATSSVFELGRGMNADATGRVLAPYDPLQRRDGWIHRELGPRLSFAYIARRLVIFAPIDPSIMDRMRHMAFALGPSDQGQFLRAAIAAAGGQGEAAARLVKEAFGLQQESQLLRYEHLRASFGALARDAAPSEVVEEAERLTAVPRAVLAARRHAARNEWDEVAKLDSLLATSRWTDPWMFDVVQLRADWRTRVSNEGLRARFGDEALALVDRAILIQPTIAMFGLRARAGLTANRSDVLIESVAGYAQGLASTAARLPPAERAEARRTIEGLIELLDSAAKNQGANARRAGEVRERLAEAARQLG
jgi:spermidine synthase